MRDSVDSLRAASPGEAEVPGRRLSEPEGYEERRVVRLPLPSWNQFRGWLRELDTLRRTSVEEGGFAAAAAS